MAVDSLDVLLQYAEDHPFITALVSATVLITLTSMSPGRMLGISKRKYYHARKTLSVKSKDGQTTSFAELCKSVSPTCRLNPFLFNGHLQTIWTVLKKEHISIYYRRHIFQNEDPTYTGQFSVDFVTAPYKGHDAALPPRTTYYTDQEFDNIGSLDTRPMLVMLHGLKGGSHEIYIRHVLAPLVGDGGWEACVVNSRGCSNSRITTSVLYNARATWDIKQTVQWLRKTFPNRPLFGIGFSLGANIITNVSRTFISRNVGCITDSAVLNYLVYRRGGEQLCVQSCVHHVQSVGLAGKQPCFAKDMVQAKRVLQNIGVKYEGSFRRVRVLSPFLSRTTYHGTDKVSVNSHVEQIVENPKINVDLVRSCKHLYEFDRYAFLPPPI